MNNPFIKMFGTFLSPEIQGCLKTIDSITGFKLSAADRQPFLYFHNYLTEPQPDFITQWRSDKKKEKWYLRFSGGILDDVQNSFACILYHYNRLVELENTVIEAIEQYNYRKVLGDSNVGLGNTLIWDFEYQAFILAFRRCLDYLARSISAYFKNDFHSFRTLDDFLAKRKCPTVADPLTSLHGKYSQVFGFVLSDGTRKSVRDKITHYEFVPAGVINLSKRGFMLAGGGEELGLKGGHSSILLSEALQKHVANVRNCLREFIYTYVDTIKINEAQKSA